MLLRIKYLINFVFIVCASISYGDDQDTLLVLGDSLSAGYGIEVSQGWVSLLQQRIDNNQYNYKVINGSISGNTTADGLGRLPALIAKYQPAIVLVALGSNDGLRGYPIKLMSKNLSRIIDTARSAEAEVLMTQLKIPPNYGRRYTQQFEGAFPTIAKQHEIPLLPFLLEQVATQKQLMQNDGLHPKASAQQLILDTLWPVIETTLRKQG